MGGQSHGGGGRSLWIVGPVTWEWRKQIYAYRRESQGVVLEEGKQIQTMTTRSMRMFGSVTWAVAADDGEHVCANTRAVTVADNDEQIYLIE